MGLDINGLELLLTARREGINLGHVLTLGRLDLNIYPAKMVSVFRRHGVPTGTFEKAGPECAYADPAFLALGATKVSAMDFSPFEGAEFVHDLNQPLPPELKERFDLVFDGGTLEHVFDFPRALQSAMELVKPGGRLIIHTCANNACGHGFYQFSPELFYRALSPQNGFVVERMIAHRVGPYGGWYEVSDPDQIRARVELISFTPVNLLILARRERAVPIFAKAPLQSDYVALWAAKDPAKSGSPAPAAQPQGGWLSRVLPGLARLLHVAKTGIEFYRFQSLFNRRAFRRVRRP